MNGESCKTCRYFDPNGRPAYGLCKRYPKAEEVHSGYWCGEFAVISQVNLKEPAKKDRKTA